MVDYAPGMRTIIRDEEWMVKKVEKNNMGNNALYCVGVSPLVKDKEAVFLTDLEEIAVVDPKDVKLVIDGSSFFRRTQLYLESQWRQQIPTDTDLHIGDKAAMDLMPYQLEPAQISLRRPRQRILIADTVGLGKTLEAGILMSELIARGKGRRILVVTVKSMMTQFQKEMWNRFTIPLVRLDSKKIHDIRAKLPSNYNPFSYYDKTIVSIDTLKRDVEYRTHLEKAYWDIIVIDEAQNVAERGDHQAQRSRLAKLLADRSDTMIMLSATPHDGRAKSFASLMNMLDPTAIANPDDYTKDDIKGLCVRRFKKDVKDQVSGSFLERRIELQRCKASAKEEIAFDIFAEMQLQMDLSKTRAQGQLFKTSLEKSLFSSPAACIKSIDARLNKLRKKYSDNEIKDIRALEELKSALENITPSDFSRYQQLLALLKDKEYGWTGATDDRVVIFTERIETMKYLAARLREDLKMPANAIQEISGAMSDAEQQTIVENFGREEAPVRVLVASDVASEGLNLHYLSHRMIHFDIPWSLMVFQQRNGRIDRYGQQKRPDIRYMMIESNNPRIKGDMRIIEILITKEEQALKNIGDPALLLGKFSIEDEELVVSDAIESGSDADAFSEVLDSGEAEFDPFEALMAASADTSEPAKVKNDETLFSDADYLYLAMSYLNQSESHPVEKLQSVSGMEVTVTPDMRKRLTALLPDEAMPQGDYLRLSDDKEFCMGEMKRSMQNNMAETAWPKVQYLWKQHPYGQGSVVDIPRLRKENPRLNLAYEIAEQNHFMHWELEFADLFAERGGFDLVIGNPPWIKVEWNEQGVLSDRHPMFAVKKLSATQTTHHRSEALSNEVTRRNYLNEFEMQSGQQAFLNAIQNYDELRGQQTNLFKCFLPQAWRFGSKDGVSAFIHPDGVYDDPKGDSLRIMLYPRLRRHYQFVNEKLLFAEVGHPTVFSLNVYGSPRSLKNSCFHSISNLFDPSAIDQCYEEAVGEAEGIKNENGEWSIKGHPDRVLKYGEKELSILAALSDDDANPYAAKLLALQTKELLETIQRFADYPSVLRNVDIYMSEMWHETYAQNDGTIRRNTTFPSEKTEMICSGPHIAVGNPVFKTPRAICEEKGDYDVVDLTAIPDNYMARTNYTIDVDLEEYIRRDAEIWGVKYHSLPRLVSRKMLNLKQERTFNVAIIPEGYGHINGLVGVAFSNYRDLLIAGSSWASIPLDFYVKVMGKANFNFAAASGFPVLNSKYDTAIITRGVLLNAVTKNYALVYEKSLEYMEKGILWAKEDIRLPKKELPDKWDRNVALRTDYERRQALVEIDVLTAMAIGMSLKQLKSIYRLQFAVSKQYEIDTWYDSNGRIVFTNNRSMTGVGFERKEWENGIKGSPSGKKFYRTITDDTMPGGPVERTIEYVAPFDRCDREQDYEIAWKFFEEKYKDSVQ